MLRWTEKKYWSPISFLNRDCTSPIIHYYEIDLPTDVMLPSPKECVMDLEIKKSFMEKWEKYFPGSELPIACFYADVLDGVIAYGASNL